MNTIKRLIMGNEKFKKEYFPYFEKDLKESVQLGQRPEVLFIGCSDSRVTPELMLDTQPGDMFILRNVGNFVPPYKHDEDFHGSAAAIEFAVSVLNVKNIIICGHSHCGACKALYDDISDDSKMVHVRVWLELGQEAKQRTIKSQKFETLEEKYRATERNSIRNQLENLLTYPEVKKRFDNKEILIHGWYYDIETGNIDFYDKNEDNFKPLKEFTI
ncbi:Carbonate dehydratase [Arcobacter nitrofigilis DSM 7299]|uniref:Carbonic anhydrase n=1 Tax=Arcobacter nitrofigilis (strain ATCC 33309 / DSM 7299 / CCUG 15893 / LMG 7604 / NCTC 12251 / CI) TaxID=572480 RepID=D5V749_ARCNC|nr:carbonic anhydrase [Arcobacter nitrofigilis]ADG94469.1 Carbonate dehydratase [Arcobacter nitrofigilis DSM 7299]